jgi:hypothetical protein
MSWCPVPCAGWRVAPLPFERRFLRIGSSVHSQAWISYPYAFIPSVLFATKSHNHSFAGVCWSLSTSLSLSHTHTYIHTYTHTFHVVWLSNRWICLQVVCSLLSVFTVGFPSVPRQTPSCGTQTPSAQVPGTSSHAHTSTHTYPFGKRRVRVVFEFSPPPHTCC